jgi:biotin carboxylase
MRVLLLFPLFQAKLDRYVALCRRKNWQLSVMCVRGVNLRYDRYINRIIEVDRIEERAEPYLGLIEKEEFDSIVPFQEFAVVLAEALSEALGLPHNRAHGWMGYRNKRLMRQILAGAGIEQPKILLVVSEEISDSDRVKVGQLKFPVVVKPADCAGSINVKICTGPQEVLAAVSQALELRSMDDIGVRFGRDVLIEEAIQGQEYSQEVIVSRGKVVYGINTFKVVSGAPYCDEIGHIIPAPLSAQSQQDCLLLAQNAAHAFGFEHGIMHIEYKLINGRPSVIEIGFRLAGDAIPEMIEMKTGLQFEEIFVRLRAGELVEVAPLCPALHAQHIAVKFHFDHTRDIRLPHSTRLLESVIRYQPPGAKRHPVRTFLFNRIGHSIVESESFEELVNYIRD